MSEPKFVILAERRKKRFSITFLDGLTPPAEEAVRALYATLGKPLVGEETIAWLREAMRTS